MINSLTLLLGMGTAMLFEMEDLMTDPQQEFFGWWKDALHAVVYEGKPVPLRTLPEKD